MMLSYRGLLPHTLTWDEKWTPEPSQHQSHTVLHGSESLSCIQCRAGNHSGYVWLHMPSVPELYCDECGCCCRFLSDEGIEFLREYLNLPSEIVPATLKKSTRPLERGGP